MVDLVRPVEAGRRAEFDAQSGASRDRQAEPARSPEPMQRVTVTSLKRPD
jgi:hypothetical protein